MPRFNYRPEEEAEMHFIYGLCDGNASVAAREYRRRYPDRRTPNPHTFINFHRRFREQGLKKTPHERDINLTVQDEDGIMNVIIEDPTLSTRRVGQIYVWGKSHPYHYRKVQGLLPHDNFSRIAFCQRMNALLTEDPQLIGKILWMDEAQFTRAGIMNTKNFHHWSEHNPKLARESSFQHEFSVNMWAGILNNQLIGPVEIPSRLNGENYLEF